MTKLRLSALALVLALTLSPLSARAFSPRVHMLVANRIHTALEESGDGRIQLRWSNYSVQLPAEDAQAILDNPTYFRGGVVGPDSFVFPAMTDGTHALDQDPFRQCQILYEEAFTSQERAYALGCFLHGSTDGFAHHIVNDFTGETFTLDPLSSERGFSLDNVVGHIVAESAIQSAFYDSNPQDFNAENMEFDIPEDFVLRMYFTRNGRLWQRMTRDAVERWEEVKAEEPDGNLSSWIPATGYAPWQHIAMAPEYIYEVHNLLIELRATMVARINELTTHPDVQATPGADGVLGTRDDDVECAYTCAAGAEYTVLTALLTPRVSAGAAPLPPVFDLISDDVSGDVDDFLPALLDVILNLIRVLHAPIVDDGVDHTFDIDRAAIDAMFVPLDDWAARTTAIQWENVGRAVAPTWYNELNDLLPGGVIPSLAEFLQALFQPIVDEIRDAVIQEIRDRAAVYIDELKEALESLLDPWTSMVANRADEYAAVGLGGNIFDAIESSGLLAYSVNITAVALANHEVMLSPTDEERLGAGIASFDASYTPHWSQLGLCPYLQEAVFPRGLNLAALHSVEIGGMYYPSNAVEPVSECHDGSLSMFGAPSLRTCAHRTLDELLTTPTGSITRAYPPTYAFGMPRCRGLRVMGLPDPPPGTGDAGPGTPGADGSIIGPDGGIITPPEPGGCGCRVPASGGSSPPLGLLFLGLGLLLVSRRRGRRVTGSSKKKIAIAAALTLLGCDSPMSADGGRDAAVRDSGTATRDAGRDAGPARVDAGPGAFDAGTGDLAMFLAALDGTVWSDLQTRLEVDTEITRAYELHFQGISEPMWGEIRNPYGPGRQRVLRFMRPGSMVCASPTECSFRTTVSIPDATWETPESLRGVMETWSMRIIDGTPRALGITNSEGVEEFFNEQPWPEPETGLTAEIRLFDGGAGTEAGDWFCSTELGFNSIDYEEMFDFFRGDSAEPVLAYEVAAGVALNGWVDVDNRLSVRDVEGFRATDLGGSVRTDNFNFVVRYRGVLTHTPGQSVAMRERDDSIEDGMWAFIGSDVGSRSPSDLFLEVHHWPFLDMTDDEPSVTLPAAEVPIELLLIRCEMDYNGEQMHPEMRLNGAGSWQPITSYDVRPVIDETMFPPVF